MEANWTGEVKSIFQDYQTGKFNVTLTINEGSSIVNALSELSREKLSISAKKYRKKRSLDANSYAWVLMSKIADAIGTSKDEVYEEMLQRYGYLDEDENGYILITARADIDVKRLGGHWKFCKSNGKFNAYIAIKGSSRYDSAEMAKFIDQIIYEAKELGIETATPDEIERMKSTWGKSQS